MRTMLICCLCLGCSSTSTAPFTDGAPTLPLADAGVDQLNLQDQGPDRGMDDAGLLPDVIPTDDADSITDTAPLPDTGPADVITTDGSYCAGQICCAEELACYAGWDGGTLAQPPVDPDAMSNCDWCTYCASTPVSHPSHNWYCNHCDRDDSGWQAYCQCLGYWTTC